MEIVFEEEEIHCIVREYISRKYPNMDLEKIYAGCVKIYKRKSFMQRV